ncbi:class I SAM-dependent methyltransferase [Marinithermus hydrothermalis]|uniref:Methyltransferase type 11 n=1 Tax=Marinithermus hydrothermalis (strain DSM 14884 / JCM 11576 / T1) TaxID=869210 RepID=F2NM22_MARHT|nr:class I SAM-dependent methyltransferase [Marinithermus hydrothermalis]AEB11492.1 Methyltransferase type 11 [Marinithermus hydrothermalis DSM 14884]
MTAPCPACRAGALEVFFEARDVPVYANVQWPTAEAARAAARGDLVLGFCGRCGMIYNLAFDSARLEYDEAYENSLHFSPTFARFAEELARGLVERYGVRGKTVLEIGCGKGEFLSRLVELGDNRGIGIDPSCPGVEDPRVRVIPAYFSADRIDATPDLIVLRHVLEHVPDPHALLAEMRRVARPGTVVYIEVPNALFTLEDLGIWDLIYEHCAYYTPVALEGLVRRAGFSPRTVYAHYGGQFLSVEAVRNGGGARLEGEGAGLAPLVRAFAGRYREKIAYWRDTLERWGAEGRRVALWGAGSKGVTFLNLVGRERVCCAVDVNPRKQGKYVAGTGQEIVPPARLGALEVDTVLVMNPNYRYEIEETLAALGVQARTVLV